MNNNDHIQQLSKGTYMHRQSSILFSIHWKIVEIGDFIFNI